VEDWMAMDKKPRHQQIQQVLQLLVREVKSPVNLCLLSTSNTNVSYSSTSVAFFKEGIKQKGAGALVAGNSRVV
jgi:hypothetical protein